MSIKSLQGLVLYRMLVVSCSRTCERGLTHQTIVLSHITPAHLVNKKCGRRVRPTRYMPPPTSNDIGTAFCHGACR